MLIHIYSLYSNFLIYLSKLRSKKGSNINFNFFHSSSQALKKRLTNLERSKFKLDPFIKQVLIGSLLGDAHMRKFSDKANARLVFSQGIQNTSYLLHLYNLFKEYVWTSPKISIVTNKNTQKLNFHFSFATLALPCFNELYELFYISASRKKIIPNNIIELLTPISLAYWIMDDGSFTGSGLKLHTNAFSIEELKLLVEVLKKNFNLIVTIQISNKEKLQYNLYISKKQMPLLIEIVKIYIHPMMLYKLNINCE